MASPVVIDPSSPLTVLLPVLAVDEIELFTIAVLVMFASET
jgi:2-phospho-L-lactate transferase/gluconeogenesis factor (CofD/UPF0052 family)